jgi:ribose 5-phosphate isomerase B
MKIAIGSDHRGLELKARVVKLAQDNGSEIKDFGAFTEARVDYPNIAEAVGKAVVAGQYDKGILICGTGIGMCIAANKVKGVRAALALTELMACRSRQHNDANILCLGAENDDSQLAQMIKAFLTCQFEGGRHEDRVKMMTAIENEK